MGRALSGSGGSGASLPNNGFPLGDSQKVFLTPGDNMTRQYDIFGQGNVDIITATGTYTPKTSKIRVSVFGGGGAGGSGVASSGSGSSGMGYMSNVFGYGGAGGGYARSTLDVQIGVPIQVTVGAGGAAVSGTKAPLSYNQWWVTGNSGGTTSFGQYLSATGGQGGSGYERGDRNQGQWGAGNQSSSGQSQGAYGGTGAGATDYRDAGTVLLQFSGGRANMNTTGAVTSNMGGIQSQVSGGGSAAGSYWGDGGGGGGAGNYQNSQSTSTAYGTYADAGGMLGQTSYHQNYDKQNLNSTAYQTNQNMTVSSQKSNGSPASFWAQYTATDAIRYVTEFGTPGYGPGSGGSLSTGGTQGPGVFPGGGGAGAYISYSGGWNSTTQYSTYAGADGCIIVEW